MSEKLKVFLGSAMFEGEFCTERELLPLLFSKPPLSALFSLWRIEDTASSDAITEHFLSNVRDAQVLVILLGSNLRQAVVREWRAARSAGLHCFAFTRQSAQPSRDMTAFIEKEVHPSVTSVSYSSMNDLATKVEDSLIARCQKALRIDSVSSALGEQSVTLPDQDATEEKCLRMLVGVLSTEQAQLTRDHVLRAAVVNCLLGVKTPLAEPEIVRHLCHSLGLSEPAVGSVIADAIRVLAGNGEIERKDGRFALSQGSVGASERAAMSIEQREEDLFHSFFSRKGHSAKCDFGVWRRVMKEAVANLIQANALSAARACYKGDFSVSGMQADELYRLSLAALSEVRDLPQGKMHWHPLLMELVQDDSTDVVEWLALQFRAYWSLAVLGCDPDIVRYQCDHLRNYKLYLDSHIVLRAMVGAGDECDVCRSVIRLSREHGVALCMSTAVFDELWHAFQIANNAYHQAGRDISRAMALCEKLGRRNDIFAGYLRECSQNHGMEWSNYLNRFYSPVHRAKTIDFLREEMGVHVVEEDEFSTDELGRIEDITQHLLLKRGGKDTLTEADAHRQYTLRNNEARQMAVVYCERSRPDADARTVWFVTYDTYVYRVSVDLARSGDAFYGFPCFMKPAKWLEIAASVSRTTTINSFREILLSREVQRLADRVEAAVLGQMLESRVDLAVKSVTALRGMFADIVCKPAVQEAYEAMVHAQGAEAIKAAERTKDAIIQEMAVRIREQENQIQERDEEVRRARRDAEKAHGRAKYFKAQATKARLRRK